MKRTIILALLIAVSLTSWSQSVMISRSLEMISNSQALIQYNNIFGEFENKDVDDSFPYVVIQMNLTGDAQTVRQAKENLGLDIGSLYAVASTDRNQENQILFLVSSNVRNIYLLCGDGCEKKLLYSGNLIRNRVYRCTISYTPVENKNNETEMLKAQMAEMQKQMAAIQKQNEERKMDTLSSDNKKVADNEYKPIETKQENYQPKSHYELRNAKRIFSFPISYSYYKFIGGDFCAEPLHGFNISYLIQYPIYRNIVIMFSMEYQFNMCKTSEAYNNITLKNHLVKFPLRLGFSVPIYEHTITAFFGPSLDVNYTIANYVSGSANNEVDYIKNNTLNVIDVPLGLGFTYMYKKFGIKFSYEWGMISRIKNDKTNSRSDQITAGVFIGF